MSTCQCTPRLNISDYGALIPEPPFYCPTFRLCHLNISPNLQLQLLIFTTYLLLKKHLLLLELSQCLI